MSRLWVLGAPDPEMERIEAVLRTMGEDVVHAMRDGRRVHAGNAYRADPPTAKSEVIAVECGWDGEPRVARRCDHHRPGDIGYGRPPGDFLRASSLGQVIELLAQQHDLSPLGWSTAEARSTIGQIHRYHRDGSWVITDVTRQAWRLPTDIVYAAAADHCLAAAYTGRCPGIRPDALMRWRAETRAAHQGRSVEDVLADIERARVALAHADLVRFTTADCAGVCTGCGAIPADPEVALWDDCCCPHAADMRGQHVPELPEASARDGVCFVADGLPDRDGRVKVVCQSGSPEQIEAFLRWAQHEGLVDAYGDPARGFAGAYRPAS